MFISELFYSIQGEGSLVGVPSVFIRTSGCNLRCQWCDTPYTSWQAKGEHRSVVDLVRDVESHSAARHVVITGGEPMLASDLPELTAELKSRNYHLTIETAGTVTADISVDLYSISPKLSNSTPSDQRWRHQHESTRLSVPVLSTLMAAADYQLKFVISSGSDLDEMQSLLKQLPDIQPWKVLLMPESRSVDELNERQAWLSELCKDFGYRYCDRFHLRLYGNTPGT